MVVARVIGTRSTSGAGTAVIPAPEADQEVRIYFGQIQAETETPVTVLLKGGADVIDRVRCAKDATGKMRQYTDFNCLRCGAGNAVFIDLSVNAEIAYVLEYLVVGID